MTGTIVRIRVSQAGGGGQGLSGAPADIGRAQERGA